MFIYEVYTVSVCGRYSLMGTFAHRKEAIGYADYLKDEGAARVVMRVIDRYRFTWTDCEIERRTAC